MNPEDLVRRLGWTDSHHPPRTPKVGNFGDSPELSRELLALVRQGRKTATASLVWEWEAEGQTLPVTRACAALGKIPTENMPIVCTRFRVLFDAEAKR